MEAVTAALTSSQAVQTALHSLAALQLTESFWPEQASVQDGDAFDFIVIGCGTAGSVIANRLTEVDHFNVLCIEAGGDPPVTSVLPILFALLVATPNDWNFPSQNDYYSAQNLQESVVRLTAGKMLGGSSSLDHMVYIRGCSEDYQSWADIADDNSWNWDGLYNYFLKAENLKDKDILNSPYKLYHGLDGYLKMARQPHNVTTAYLNSFAELETVVLDILANNCSVGYTQALLTIYDYRQSNAYGYLTPIKNRPNLHILKNSLVTKIITDNNVAVAVEVVTENNETIYLKANKEIIVTAGAVNSPKVLLLSGIGPKEHLESLDIKVISDLPVGQNFQDQSTVFILHEMDLNANVQLIPTEDPLILPPVIVGNVALNRPETCPDYQSINLLVPYNSQYQITLFCSIVFKYKEEICKKMYEANVDKNIFFSIHHSLHPKSRGNILLKSKNPFDDPLIYIGAYSNITDLKNHAIAAKNFTRAFDTSYFRSVNAKLLSLGLCTDLELGSLEFWECYILNMSATSYEYTSTCALGEVVDKRLKVKNVQRLRVADASVFPNSVSTNLKATVTAVAEKAADLIKEDFGVNVNK